MINTPQAPYFDDFNVEKNFLKILFKPKLSVQTRELEQIQSMFQNQIETLASQIFKNGSVVSGGKFTFQERVDYVKIYNDYNSQIFNYNIYKDRYVYGTTTKILARVFNGWSQTANEVASLYLDYLSGGENAESTFQPGEVLQLVSNIYLSKISGDINIGDTLQGQDSGAIATVVNIDNSQYDVVYSTNNTFTTDEQVIDTTTSAYYLVTAGESVIYKAQVKNTADDVNSVGYGSAVYVDEGIYYIDGYFVHTGNQSKIISNYSTQTNARVGFEKEVEIITSDQDPSLLDNANGYPNANAPGADRLKINLVLNYYNLYETPSENFVEILTVENSTVTGNASINQRYADIIDTMARRTYDESGNYTVKPFLIDIREFLDDGENNGVYKPEYFGYSTQAEALNASMKMFGLAAPGQSHIYGTKYYPYDTHEHYLEACKNRLALGVETGKAYVMGYEIDHIAKEWFPLLKARDTKVLNNSASTIFYGNYIKVNNITGLPDIYKHALVTLSSDSTFVVGQNEIGTARVYGFEVESGVPGTPTCVYRMFLESINMEDGYSFSTDVNSLAALDTSTQPATATFTAKTVKNANNVIAFSNIANSALIFPMEKTNISGVEDSSYNYKKIFTGTITTGSGSLGTFTIPADVSSRFVDISNPLNYLVTITSGTLAGTIVNLSDIAMSIDASGNLTFSGLDADSIDCGYMVIATLHKQVNNIKSKTLYSNVEYVYIPDGTPIKEIVLDHADGYRLVGIYESADAQTTPTVNDTDITDNFDFDDGQRDTYYDLARIVLKEGTIAPTGQVLVVYDYFAHSSGDYFTVDSYTGQVDYTDIPYYVNENGMYDLKDCIDARGRVDENGSGNFSASTLPYIFQNNSLFECDLGYYLPRLDLLELDYKGNFNVKYGTSSEDPQYPIGSINSMTLYYLVMPAYTEEPEDVIQVYCENKRYTMRDIGNLDNRISAIEDYITLNDYENDTNNLAIYDASGYQCVKTGFIVDIFTDHTYGDTTDSNYRCSVDPDNFILRPDYKIHTIELEKSTSRQSDVVLVNGLYMVPHTTKQYITNSINTSYIAINSNKLVEWEGNVVLNRSLSTIYNADGVVDINFGQALSQSVSTGLTPNENVKIFGQHKYSWIGINDKLD